MREDELIRRAMIGESRAFEDLIIIYKKYVFSICYKLLKDVHLAENLSQETFLQVYLSIAKFDNKNFKNWIGRIATNKCLDYIRKEKVQTKVVEVLKETREESKLNQNPIHNILHKEKKEIILKGINRLPDKYGKVLIKYYIENKDYSTIAVEEGIKPRTVETRLYRAKKLLKNSMGDELLYEGFL
ncbi:RNA polymerase sigma factor [Oceanirhabdus sp. W0125-5]|uniref:RNA polymerase sigma factor n=1 Tax=Oceanirhabdus sp. W0125-5 TaxID=2999116 RepID=UPI0022F2C269|nr:RNA polymerase sigma factor [Oceanirhabdus sp. W0125-5]WBW97457.1 RNA polymerase sigma factor [Oceanirhabdus sp. W0125-5]